MRYSILSHAHQTAMSTGHQYLNMHSQLAISMSSTAHKRPSLHLEPKSRRARRLYIYLPSYTLGSSTYTVTNLEQYLVVAMEYLYLYKVYMTTANLICVCKLHCPTLMSC